MSRSPHRSDTSASGSDSADETTPKLNPNTLGTHDSSHSCGTSKKSHVGSWVTAQNEFANNSMVSAAAAKTHQTNAQNTTPAILLTDVDEDDTLPTEILSPQEKVHFPVRGRRHSLEPRLSPRKVSMFPAPLEQPILEEPEDDKQAEDSEEDSDYLTQQQMLGGESQIPRIKTDAAIAEELLVGINNRQRAKSYPSSSPSQPVPLLELPRPNVSSNDQQTTSTDHPEKTGTGWQKFAQVAIMAKKWKKRSADCENEVFENTQESVAIRQKKRPFVEVPRALKVEILEDAYPIVQKTYQMYKSYLGPKHKLTVLAEKHLENLSLQLEK